MQPSFPYSSPSEAATADPADTDPRETREWLDALDAVVGTSGERRGLYLLQQLQEQAQQLGILAHVAPFSAYRNTIGIEAQGAYPGDLVLEERLTAIMRWNALAMVVRANRAYGELGGHIASYASAAEIFETGFNHFFHAGDGRQTGDLVFFQPHSAPGVYARAFLEGRLSEADLDRYRQEVGGGGLSSYPHPWLMPEFWQFPTGSMGLGPIQAVYQARFLRYLEHRGQAQTAGRRVWGIFGDGEMDEPESIAGLTLAARERLDNLCFIINCNLQRLDGPVRGNGQIIQELEALFTGAGWNVIKVLWGSDWDPLFARDTHHVLLRRFAATVDGQYQTLGANDGAYNQEHFFDLDPELHALVSHMTAAEIDALKRGGHDFRKLYAAFRAAGAHRDRPTVILAKTKKGYGMGSTGESRMVAHQQKKLDFTALAEFRDRFHLPLTDEDLQEMRFYRPAEGSRELNYLRERRSALGGPLPMRRNAATRLVPPPLQRYAGFALEAAGKEMSTTVAAVRMLGGLLKDAELGPRLVPIVADEARTFGMANLFRQIGIYAPDGQRYRPEDAGSMLVYREARDGQILEEGITEAGAVASWIAAATAYSTHGLSMLPIYIFYSMFGFQRVGDLLWAAADQRARGFLFGATSGRTTLGGEGLQHQDGQSHVLAATVPNCRAYDPAFAAELAVILDRGMQEMLVEQRDVFYYITMMNESYPQPSLAPGNEEGILRGMYRLQGAGAQQPCVRLLGSGAILQEVCAAARLLAEDWQVASEVYSVTSYSELEREARAVARHNRLHPGQARRRSHVQECLAGPAPVVAASDYLCAHAQRIAPYLSSRFLALGTDGFGRSDTRATLRRFFEVDRYHIALVALDVLSELDESLRPRVAEALERYRIDTELPPAWEV
ncbi:MAG: alpha-ketoglutarate dehydrogenase [Betaproteobacteria bacterium]|nr:alpha-ketoglutarate dehydrogenase [Betaproteobacteria bacterium]